ncbi:hypothetical protein E1B28_012994 [Marasmius oreades]|uniref:Uncharacterized protein n=1 Tax=Marasmius oreades TaxID=181124 RepID=A0A9P7UNK2_9AGAR|nr:uncharacterized protein E1B28_012994 [Marasmius oreades]KAG7087016.1 hypothetical protein E1B28_012994 [Marasmius oreades]
MPAPDVSIPTNVTHSVVGHVNLMVDTFLANVDSDELLSSGLPDIAKTFNEIARGYYSSKGEEYKPNYKSLFRRGEEGAVVPTEDFNEGLIHGRSLYGIGMGLAALEVLAFIVSATVGIRWREGDKLYGALVVLDSDITQAIQSCKEEKEAGRIVDQTRMRKVVENLRSVLKESSEEVRSWDGVFPFDKATSSVQYWKV